MRNADLLAELQKLRDQVALLAQKSAAAEERTFHLAASVKDLKQQQQQQQQDVSSLQAVVSTERQRLNEVERHGRRLFKTIRNQIRDDRSADRAFVEALQKQAGVHVKHNVEDDTRSTTSEIMRAESLVQSIGDAQSEVGYVVSHGPQFWRR